MTRVELPNGRHGITMPVEYVTAGGHHQFFDATFGITDRVVEVFMRATKEGNDFSILLQDACIAISLLLQHGETAADLVRAFSDLGPIAAIVRAAAELDERIKAEI